MINHNYSAFLLIIFVAFMTVVRSQFLSLRPVTTTINVNSNYIFTIIDSNFNGKSGTVNIYFNTSYFTLTGTYPCAQASGTTSYTCTATASNVISFPFTSTGQQSITMTIQNIKNPSIVSSFSFTYVWVPSSGSTSSYTNSYDGYTTAQLTSCSIVMSNSTVNTVSEMQFTMTLKNQVGLNGGISLAFPSSWTYSKNSTAKPISSTSTQTYRRITGSTLAASLTPTVAIGTQSIQLSSLFSAITAGGTSISFGISGILSPATTYDGNTVTITTLNSNNNKIDQSSCFVSGITAQSITITTGSSFTVGTSTNLITTWTTASTLAQNDTITVTLPDSMSFSLTNSFSLMQYGSANSRSIMSISSGSTTNQIILTLNQSITLIPTDSISFNITNVVPQINSASRSISYSVKRSGYFIATGQLSITVSANSLTGTTITSTNSVVSSTGNLTISFILANPLATSSSIKITFPSSFSSLPASPTCNVTSSNNFSLLSSTPICSFSSRVLKVQSYLINNLPALANLAITIPTVGNPNTVASTDAFLIYTYYNSSLTTNIVDQSISTKFTAIAASITTASVTHAGSNVVAQVTPYTINYQIKSFLPSNAIVVLGIPKELSLSTNPTYTMSINGATASLFTPGVDTTTSTSYFYLNFTNIFSSDRTSGTNLTFIISSLRNPLSLKPSDSFTIYSYGGSYSLLQQSITSGLSVSVTTMNSFSSLYIDVATRINSKSTIYTFVIQPSVTLNSGDKLVLTLGTGNNPLSYSTTVTCTAGGIAATVVKLNLQLTITLGTQLIAGSVYQIVITSLILGRTFAQSPNMVMKAETSLGYGVSTATLTPPVNNQANYLNSLTMTIQQNPSQLNQLQSFVISFSVTTPLISTDYIEVQIPTNSYLFTQTSLRTTSICLNTNYNCLMITDNSFKITSSTFSNTTTVSLTLVTAFYRSPITFSYLTNDYLIVKTYDSTGGIMDTTDTTLAATQAVFTLTCAKYCKTCRSTNTSYCTACYTIGEGYTPSVTYDNYNFITSDGQCVTTCGDGYYNSSNTCVLCNAPCQYCQNSTACITCITSYSLTTNKQCLAQCPDKTYSNSGVCSDCGGLCETCVNSSITCTSCKAGYLLNNTVCITSCPGGTYQSNSVCSVCDTSCITCITSSTNCITCQTGYYNTSTSGPGLCVNTCPTGTVNYTNPSTGSWTCGCAAQCLTCSTTQNTCSTCNNPGSFPYYNAASNTCSSSCSSGTYLNGSNCIVCPQKNCVDCDTNGCTLCDSSSSTPYLKSGACVTSCPQTTTLQNVSCVDCSTGCKICITPSSCTSCLNSFLLQQQTCVTSCSTANGFINFNATVCLKECPSGYSNISNKCQLSSSNNTNTTSNTTNSTTTQTTQTLTSSKIVPFPIIIGYIVIWAIVIASRVAIQSTIVPCGVVAFGSLMQIGSWFTLLIVSIAMLGFSSVAIILFLAIFFNFILNILSLVFLIKYTQADPLATKHVLKCSISNKIIKGISLLTMHKFLQLQFSCLFGLRIFSCKVTNVSVFTPLNILLYVSILPSLLAITAGGIASYQVQDQKLNSPVFIQALDCIIVTVLNLIVTIWATIRRPDQFEDSMDNAKFYDTTDQLIGKENREGIIEQPFLQQSGNRQDPYHLKTKVNGKTYYYNSSRKVGNQEDKQAPLSRRTRPRLPIGQKDELPQINEEKSSDALVIDRSNNGRRRISSDELRNQEDLDKLDENRIGRQDNLNNSMAQSIKSPAKTVKNQGLYQNQMGSPKQLQKIKQKQLQVLHQQIIDENSQQFKALSPEQQQKQRQKNKQLQLQIQKIQNQEEMMQNNSIYSKATSPMRAMKKKNNKFQGLQDQLNRSVQEIKLSPMRKMEAVAELNQILKDKHGSQIPQNQDDSNIKNKNKKSKSKSPERNKGKSKKKSPNKNDKLNSSGVNGDEDMTDNNLKRVTSQEDLKKKNSKVKKPKDTQSYAKMKNNRASINRSQDLQIIFQQNPNFQKTAPQDDFDEQQVPSIPIFHPKNVKNHNHISPADMQIVQFPEKSKIGSELDMQKNSKSRQKQGLSPKRSKQFHGQDLKQFRATENISSFSKKQMKNLKSSENLRDSSFFDRTKIINDQLQSLNSQEDMIFNNVSPSQFDVANQRFYDGDQISDMPQKPIIKNNIITKQQQDNQIISTIRDGDIQIGDSPIQPYMNRYRSSQQIDYDSVFRQNMNNQRIKDLQKIYLPRLQVKKSLDKRK